ncbi:hypothetical protein FRC08_014935 [Ceratobasidium sp. 394]|nr:hypothetical protein FRC08_014935 [Ceratobasidium sp. 394]KAG9093268.1 hypothetical protein FS749_014714 [Ceratobasidium sp. UAMH 11750]
MRSTSFLTFFILALLSVLQLSAFAEPLPADNLVERGTDLDIAPTTGGGIQQSLDGGPSENEANKSEKLVCPRESAAARAVGAMVEAAVLGPRMAVMASRVSQGAPIAAKEDPTANLGTAASGSGVESAVAPTASFAFGKMAHRLTMLAHPTKSTVSRELHTPCEIPF